ncbi:MAG: beta-propeller domain-containing protein [Candidatus Korobacteraceae bacterium]
MHRLLSATISAALIAFSLTACSDNPFPSTVKAQTTTSHNTMQAFASDKELKAYLREIADKQGKQSWSLNVFKSMASLETAAPAPPAMAKAADASELAGASESVTNVQHQGVDEGDIVKVHGDHLVILRRGRLFTVAIGDGALTPISGINAFGPDIDPANTWYDEMLVSQNSIVIIGYSYARGGTEVGLFNIDTFGNLSYRSTYQLRSNDYYSSRNYASRLIGDKLIFYSPSYIYGDALRNFPAVRKWHKGADDAGFRRIVPATQVYRADVDVDGTYTALHTVTICDLANGGFDCKATSVVGPPGRVFYVSPKSVYIWVTEWSYPGQKSHADSMLYRMPLDGSAPTALRVFGSPVDQFSFLESDDGYLNVLVRADAAGDGMWRAEVAAGDMALLRVPLDSFNDGSATVPASNYRPLPAPGSGTFQNRFVGDYFLYGAGSGWAYPQQVQRSTLYAVRWTDGTLRTLLLTHGVDRIEPMGADAVVVGTDGNDLHFTSVRLGRSLQVADDYVFENASQGELRSHGFFYKPDGEDSGMLGLPITTAARPGYRHLFENSAAILFLRNDALHFQELGELSAQPDGAKDDACRASCVDWYGNARPLFVHGRILALLGYELVEGELAGGRIQTLRRVSYAPQA